MKAAPRAASKDIAVINKIVGEFANRSRQDIQDWRQAIDAADNPEEPRWAPLQDLYEYLRPDGDLGGAMELRKGATEANRFLIRDKKTGEEVSEKTDLLKKEWFFNMISDLLDFIFFGYSLVQIVSAENGEYSLIPRRNFVPQRELILFEAFGDKGISIKDAAIADSFILIKNQYKFGIMNDVVPNLIWKKNALQAFAEFAEKFGLPLMTATTNKSNDADIARIDSMLEKLGQASRAVLPEGTTLDIKNEAKQGDPYNVFLKQVEYTDTTVAKRFLGGTMINADGSSYSQSQIHSDTFKYVIAEKDRRSIEFAVNNQLFPILKAAGFPLTDTEEFEFDRTEDLDMTEHWTVVSGLLDKGYTIPDVWLSETFNVPIEGREKPEPPKNFPPDPTGKKGDPNAIYRSFFD